MEIPNPGKVVPTEVFLCLLMSEWILIICPNICTMKQLFFPGLSVWKHYNLKKVIHESNFEHYILTCNIEYVD